MKETNPHYDLPDRKSDTNKNGKGKLLLLLLPFWTPLIPPLGIACLKSFLQKHGYEITIMDANIDDQFRRLYDKYFQILKENVPKNKWGNFYSIGHDVLRNHLMAHINYDNINDYKQLVKLLIYKTYYFQAPYPLISELNEIIDEFYLRLKKYIINVLDKEKPGVLGLSVFNATLPASLFAFRLCKEQYPHVRTVMGGGVFADQLAQGSHNLEYFLDVTKPYIDKMIIGEGEILFLKYLKGELPDSQRVYTLKDINWQTLDLSSVESHDFSGFHLEHYPLLASYSSRSCPFQCTFCAETVNWGKYRKKKASQVVDELIHFYEIYHTQLFLMGDSVLNPIISELSNEILIKKAPIYWDGYLRADKSVCNPEKVLTWRRAGFYRARLGIESGSPRVLELMDKRITPEQIKAAVYNLANAGIKTTTYWIIGYPGESEEDFQQTLMLVEELKDCIYEAECKPFYYFQNGQVGKSKWEDKGILLYPEKVKKMLVLQEWILDCKPSRPEVYQRVNRFIQHCENLGIPNPYSLIEINRADQRWKQLQKNAVPPMMSFKNQVTCVDEKRNIKQPILAQDKPLLEDGFAF